MGFKCSICGKKHEGWPVLSFDAPYSYYALSDEDQTTLAELDSDFCIIKYPQQTDRFIRGTLFQKVNEHCEDLNYGLWVSLSEKSWGNYTENFDNKNHEAGYFGYLSNVLPGYENMLNIPMNVYTQKGNDRPIIVPHQGFGRPFVEDYFNGISRQEAQKRISAIVD